MHTTDTMLSFVANKLAAEFADPHITRMQLLNHAADGLVDYVFLALQDTGFCPGCVLDSDAYDAVQVIVARAMIAQHESANG